MKLPAHSWPRSAAFTLVEILVTIALFSILLGGLVYGNVYGLKMCEMSKQKVTRSDEARLALGKFTDEVRACKDTWVGNVNAQGLFVATLEGQPQIGTALVIYPSTNTNTFIIYFRNPSDKTFRRYTSASTTPVALAAAVTNSSIFAMRNFDGTLLTNWQNNRVIHLDLEFFQARGLSPMPEYYKLATAVTKRALD